MTHSPITQTHMTPWAAIELVAGLPKPEALEMIRRLCPPASEHFEDEYWGLCPEGLTACTLHLLNVGPDHFLTCPTHELFWSLGSNLFSGWRHGSEEEWKQNFRTLEGYTRIRDGALLSAQARRVPWQVTRQNQGQ